MWQRKRLLFDFLLNDFQKGMGRTDKVVPGISPITAIPGRGAGFTCLLHIVERTPDQESGKKFVNIVILDKS